MTTLLALLFPLGVLLQNKIAVLTPDDISSRASAEALSAALLSTAREELYAETISVESFSSLQLLLSCKEKDDSCLLSSAKLLHVDWIFYSRAIDSRLVFSLFDASAGKTVAEQNCTKNDPQELRRSIRTLFAQAAPLLLRPHITDEPSRWRRLVLPGSLLAASIAAGLTAQYLQQERFDDLQNSTQAGRDEALRQRGLVFAASADLLLLSAAFTGWWALRKETR